MFSVLLSVILSVNGSGIPFANTFTITAELISCSRLSRSTFASF